jgi:molecular chaperone GrpE
MEEETQKNDKEINSDDIDVMDEVDGALAKIAKLKKDLEVCKKEKVDYLNGWKRAKADYINAERKFTGQLESVTKYSEARILKELLNIADGFENAFASAPPDSPWTGGIRYIYDKLETLLTKHGVKKIQTAGEMFNPHYHEAVEIISTDAEKDDDRIMQELQTGYMMHDKILRPSKVKVAKYNNV